jgi:predicted secreted protein
MRNRNYDEEIGMNKKIMLAAALLLLSLLLWAGDTAVFVDLGFSADGKTYMFGQYGVQTDTLRPWADLYVIDVASNSFVPGGRINYMHDSSVMAGRDGSGALYRVIARNTGLADRYNIGYLLQGQLLYVSIENGVPPERETIEFPVGLSYRAVLTSNVRDSAGSSFSISLERRTDDGSIRCYTVGNAGIKRPGIVSYKICRIFASPRNDALIFVIEMRKRNSSGSTDIRYMVETVRL